jgi:hypothetical protein
LVIIGSIEGLTIVFQLATREQNGINARSYSSRGTANKQQRQRRDIDEEGRIMEEMKA